MSGQLVDEPIFAKGAFAFAKTGRVAISNFSAPNAVFEAVWGGLFVMVLGESYEALRFSSMVLLAISVPFVYLLGRSLGADRVMAFLASASYLACPLVFSLSTTFMTDSHAMALTAMAVCLFSWGLIEETPSHWRLLGGSCLLAIGFLSRPQVLVVLVAIVLTLMFRRQRHSNWWYGLAAVSVVPLVTVVLHGFWTAHVGEPVLRQFSRESLLLRRPIDIAALASQVVVMSGFYIGLFVLPMFPTLMPGRKSVKRLAADRLALVATVGILATGLILAFQGKLPFEGHTWVTPNGIGAVDRSLLGHRPLLLPPWAWSAAGFVLLSATVALVVRVRSRGASAKSSQGFFLATTVFGFVVAAFISSVALQSRVFDRYWLPVVPLVLAVAASVGLASKRSALLSGAIAGWLGLVSVIGTLDAFSAYQASIDYADEIVADGFDPLSFDGGVAWSALRYGLTDDTPYYIQEKGGPFWLQFYAVESFPVRGLALEPLEGYAILETREYKSILHLSPTFLYVVQPVGIPFYYRVEDF